MITDKIQATESPKVGPQFSKEFSKLLISRGYNHSKVILKPKAIIKIENSIIGTPGNLSVISGENKAGKSGLVSAIIAGTMQNEHSDIDTLGLSILTNKSNRGVIHFDTEQAIIDHHRMNKLIMKRASTNSQPNWYYSFCLVSESINDLKNYLVLTCKEVAKAHKGLHLIVIDGIGDFVSSVNMEEAGNKIINLLLQLAKQYNVHIVVVLHTNPSHEKADASRPRGHLGSGLMRKAESILLLKRRKDISYLTPKHLRHAGGFGEVQFVYDTKLNYHVLKQHKSLNDIAIEKEAKKIVKEQTSEARKLDELKKEAQEYLNDESLSRSDFKDRIMELRGVIKETAYKQIRRFENSGIVEEKDGVLSVKK